VLSQGGPRDAAVGLNFDMYRILNGTERFSATVRLFC